MFTFFLLIWIILNGRVTLEIILFGILIAAAVFLFARAAFGYTVTTERQVIRYTPLALLYLVNLVVEICRATMSVIGIVVNPGRRPEPVLVEFDSGLPTDFQNVVLANSITLTPGTVTVEMEGSHFQVHCLVPEYADGIGESSFVRLLRRINL